MSESCSWQKQRLRLFVEQDGHTFETNLAICGLQARLLERLDILCEGAGIQRGPLLREHAARRQWVEPSNRAGLILEMARNARFLLVEDVAKSAGVPFNLARRWLDALVGEKLLRKTRNTYGGSYRLVSCPDRVQRFIRRVADHRGLIVDGSGRYEPT